MLRNYRLQNYNFKLLFNVLVLMAMGLLFIHSANPSFVVKQALGITMGLGIIIVVSLIDFQVFTRNAEILYIFNVIMLIGVKLFGKDVNGAKRWFSLGPLGTFQPSELSKVIMIIVIAAFLVKHQDDLNEPKILGKLALVCAVPLRLILKQPSLSSTLDICFIILGMIFMAGLSSKLIVRVLIIGVPLLAIFLWYVQTPGQVLLEPHQVARIMSFLHPENYADSTALQTSNSIMAIGSGGLFGKGFGALLAGCGHPIAGKTLGVVIKSLFSRTPSPHDLYTDSSKFLRLSDVCLNTTMKYTWVKYKGRWEFGYSCDKTAWKYVLTEGKLNTKTKLYDYEKLTRSFTNKGNYYKPYVAIKTVVDYKKMYGDNASTGNNDPIGYSSTASYEIKNSDKKVVKTLKPLFIKNTTALI